MIIELLDLNFAYPNFPGLESHGKAALTKINLMISDQEVIGIVGASGSGKTTLLQMLNGLLRPQEGAVLLDGHPVQYTGDFALDWRRQVGLVFQSPEVQFFESTIFEEMSYALRNMRLPAEEIESRVGRVVQQVGLAHLNIRDLSPFQLSEGEKRRVAIASVLVFDPPILILDEPTSALDEQGVGIVRKMVSDHAAAGHTVIVASHDMNFIAAVTHRIVAMAHGKIIFDGRKEDFFVREDLLQAAHLDRPRILTLAKALRAKGLPVDYPVFSLEQIRRAL